MTSMSNNNGVKAGTATDTSTSTAPSKPRLVDRVLAPVRQQIQDLIVAANIDKKAAASTSKVRVLDVACGTGDQLLRLAAMGSYSGLGIDLNADSIQYAQQRAQQAGFDPQVLEYRVQDLNDLQTQENRENFDIAMATLFFHVLPWPTAVSLLQLKSRMAPTLIVAAFVPGTKWQDKLLLWLDQRFTSHYADFKTYLERGSFEGLVRECGDDLLEIQQVIETNDATIRIFVLKSKQYQH